MSNGNTVVTGESEGRFRSEATLPAQADRCDHALSWGSILAGAGASAALALILLVLGTGLGLLSISPWADHGMGAMTFGVSAIIWTTFTQIAAFGMGGFLAGRLRTRWAGVHPDEVHFRDTAHGFLAWAVATIVSAAFLSSAIDKVVTAGGQTGALLVGGAGASVISAGKNAAGKGGADSNNLVRYYADSLFRKDPNASSTPTPAGGIDAKTNDTQRDRPPSGEIIRIFVNAIPDGALPPEDLQYVSQVVAQRTGLSQQDAQKRVTDVFAGLKAKLQGAEVATREAADKARKASAYVSLWLFISLLSGAFVASLAATFGGRLRDA